MSFKHSVESRTPNGKLTVTGRSRIPRFAEPVVRDLMRRLVVGKNVTVGRGLRIGRRAVVSAPHAMAIGDWVNIGPDTVIQCNGTLGAFCLIGRRVQIIGRDDHALDEIGVPSSLSTWVGDRNASERDSVNIERDVWIGGGTIVMSGVTIGEGSVVGAGSVVTKSIPPYSIAAGNPARVIGQRFNSDSDRERHSRRLTALLNS